MDKKSVIEKVYENSRDAIVPTLLTFQNGDLTVTSKDRVQYCTILNKKTRSKEALLVVDKHIYKGAINETEKLADTYVCVRNRTTNKVRILPLDQANLKNCVFAELQQKQLEKQLQPLSADANRKRLAKDFRGRKAATLYDAGEKMQVSVEIIKDDLEATVKEATIDEEIKVSESALDYICPKCNKDATSLSEVYNINDLMAESLLNRLDSEAKAVLDADLKSLPIKSAHLLSCIESLKTENVKQSEALFKTKIIIFMDCLFNFLTSNERIIKNIELSGITEKVEYYMRRVFLEQGLKSSTMSDKALCYYIALCLMIDKNNSANVAVLAEELKKSKTMILTYAHLVNALPNRSQQDVITLRLPSKVPALRTSFKRKSAFR